MEPRDGKTERPGDGGLVEDVGAVGWGWRKMMFPLGF